MSAVDEIRSELSGSTNFDEAHEGELCEGKLIPGLDKADNILIAAMFIVLGVLPVIWYEVMYF